MNKITGGAIVHILLENYMFLLIKPAEFEMTSTIPVAPSFHVLHYDLPLLATEEPNLSIL